MYILKPHFSALQYHLHSNQIYSCFYTHLGETKQHETTVKVVGRKEWMTVLEILDSTDPNDNVGDKPAYYTSFLLDQIANGSMVQLVPDELDDTGPSVREAEGKWWWADENWTWYGPYRSERVAEQIQLQYVTNL